MKRAILPFAAALLFLLGSPPAAHAGCSPYCLPYGDSSPRWSADGSNLAFFRGRGTVLHEYVVTMNADGSGRREIRTFGWPGLLSPDFGRVAYVEAGPEQGELVVEGLDGTGKRALAPAADGLPVWAPNSKRIAFAGPGGRAPSWIGSDGTSLVTSPQGRVNGPMAWSDDGGKLAVVLGVAPGGPFEILTVNADGIGGHLLGGNQSPYYNAVALDWAPDGKRLAVIATRGGSKGVLLVIDDDGVFRELGKANPYGADVSVDWSPDGRSILYRGPKGWINTVNPATGVSRRLVRGSAPAWSPDGRTIAYSDAGRCGRGGIALVTAAGTGFRKLTEDCRLYGTRGDDRFDGTIATDDIYALGGNDRINARSGDDTIEGGPGKDVLIGNEGLDTFYGGRGNDLLRGDVLYGGAGRDRLLGENRWAARIYARDGQRDLISCGTPRHDKVYADRVDGVARSCEHVFRR